MRWNYARVLCVDEGASLDDHREAVATLESVVHSWKRIFGPAHPETPKAQEAEKRAHVRQARRSFLGLRVTKYRSTPTGTPSPRRSWYLPMYA